MEVGRRSIDQVTPTESQDSGGVGGGGSEMFTHRLEDRARDLADRLAESIDDSVLVSGVRQEIALTLSHIDSLRALGMQLQRSLLHNECSIDTELMQMEQRTPRYSPYRFPEREKLQRRLLELDRERRSLAVAQSQRLQTLHDQLLHLLSRHEVLDQ